MGLAPEAGKGSRGTQGRATEPRVGAGVLSGVEVCSRGTG